MPEAETKGSPAAEGAAAASPTAAAATPAGPQRNIQSKNEHVEDYGWPTWLQQSVAPTLQASLKSVADVRMKRLAAANEPEEYNEYKHNGGWWEWQIYVRKSTGNQEHDYMPSFGFGQEQSSNLTDNIDADADFDKSKKKAATEEELEELAMKEGKSEFSKCVALVSSKRNVQRAAGYSNLSSFTNSHPKEMLKLYASKEFQSSLLHSDGEMLRIAGFGFKEMLKPVAGGTIKSCAIGADDIDKVIFPFVIRVLKSEAALENELCHNTWCVPCPARALWGRGATAANLNPNPNPNPHPATHRDAMWQA